MSAERAWQGKIYVTIEEQAEETSVPLAMEGVIARNSIRIRRGSKDIKQIPLCNEGNVYQLDPEGMHELSFDMYNKDHTCDVTKAYNNPTALFMGDTHKTTEAVALTDKPGVADRKLCRVTIAFANHTPTGPANATGAFGGTAGNKCNRYVFADAYITDMDEDTSDGIKKTSVTIKLCPVDAAGLANYLEESLDGTGTDTLTALASYTASVKFRAS